MNIPFLGVIRRCMNNALGKRNVRESRLMKENMLIGMKFVSD